LETYDKRTAELIVISDDSSRGLVRWQLSVRCGRQFWKSCADYRMCALEWQNPLGILREWG